MVKKHFNPFFLDSPLLLTHSSNGAGMAICEHKVVVLIIWDNKSCIHIEQSDKQKCIPVGCIPPAH